MEPFAGILTGDIVDSRTLPPETVDKAMALIDGIADSLSAQFHIRVSMDRNRGDGWQIALPEGQPSLTAALQITARLKAELGVETRAGIGLGPADIPGDGDLAAGFGQAFQTAGQVLDTMPKNRRIAIGTDATPGIAIIIQLLDEKVQNWTSLQAGAVAAALADHNLTHEGIATMFGVTRQTMQRRLASAGLTSVQDAVAYFERHIKELWERQQA